MNTSISIGEVLKTNAKYKKIQAEAEKIRVERLITELCDGDKNLPSRDALMVQDMDRLVKKWSK